MIQKSFHGSRSAHDVNGGGKYHQISLIHAVQNRLHFVAMRASFDTVSNAVKAAATELWHTSWEKELTDCVIWLAELLQQRPSDMVRAFCLKY